MDPVFKPFRRAPGPGVLAVAVMVCFAGAGCTQWLTVDLCCRARKMPRTVFKPAAWTDLRDLVVQAVLFAREHGWKGLSNAAITRIHRANTRSTRSYLMVEGDAFSECFNLATSAKLPNTGHLDMGCIHDLDIDVTKGAVTIYTNRVPRIKLWFEIGSDGAVDVGMA